MVAVFMSLATLGYASETATSRDQQMVADAFETLQRVTEGGGNSSGSAAMQEACGTLSRLGDDELQRQWKAMLDTGFSLPVSISRLCGGGDSFDAGQMALEYGEGLRRMAADAILGEGLAWARSSGIPYLNRIEVEGGVTDVNGQFSVMSIQPWWEDREKGHFLFNQVSWQHETLETDDGDADDTVNFGLAYRKLLSDDTLLVGANMFFDHQFDQKHNRMSLGVEARTDQYDITANRYQALSGWRTIDALYESRALSGWDMEVSGQLPEYSELTGFIRGYTFDSLLGVKDIYGVNATMEWSPVPALVFSGGVTDENMRDPDLRFAMRIRMNFEQPIAEQFSKRSGLVSVADRVYDRVRRENTIRTQVRKRISTGLQVIENSGSNTAQVDEGTLGLYVGLSFNMPAVVTVQNTPGALARIRLHDGGILTVGQGSQVRIEPGIVTLITGTAQYISGSTNVTVNVPGGIITLLGTDIDLVSNGSTSTVRVRDGSVKLVGTVSGAVTVITEGMGQSVNGVVGTIASGSPTYIDHGDEVSDKLDRVGSPQTETKAAPYPTPAPRIVVDATTVGQTVQIGQQFNFPVVVSGGTPHLTLRIGGQNRVAPLVSGSGSNDLVFGYVLQAGDVGQSVITVTGLETNAASITGNGRTAVTTMADTDLNLSGAIVSNDTTPPTGYAVAFTTDPINSGNQNAAAFEITSAEVGASFNYSITSSGGGTPVIGSGTIATATQSVTGVNVSALNDGTLTVSLTLTDAATNTGAAATDTVSKSASSPTVTVSTAASDPTNSSPFTATLTFSESVTGLTAGELTVTGASASNLQTADNITYTVDITPSGDGAVTVQVPADAAQNGASNGNTISNTLSITYDGTAPTGYAVAFTTDPVNSGNQNAAAFEITSAEVGASFNYSITSSGGGTPVTGSGTIATATQSVTGINVSGLTDGTLTVSLTLTDAATNTESAATDTVAKATTGATVTVSTAASDPTNSSPFTATLTFSESVTGLTAGELTVTGGTASNLQTADNITYTVDITPSGDGAVTVQVPADAAQNGASNGNTISNTLSITYDGTAPSIQSITPPADGEYDDL